MKKKSRALVLSSETEDNTFDAFSELCTLLFLGEAEGYLLIPTVIPQLFHLMKHNIQNSGDLLTMAARTVSLLVENFRETFHEMGTSTERKVRGCFAKVAEYFHIISQNEFTSFSFKRLNANDLVEEMLKCLSAGLQCPLLEDLLPSPCDQLGFCLVASHASYGIACRAIQHCMLMIRSGEEQKLTSQKDIRLLYNLLTEKLRDLSRSEAKMDRDWDELLRTVTFCVFTLRIHSQGKLGGGEKNDHHYHNTTKMLKSKKGTKKKISTQEKEEDDDEDVAGSGKTLTSSSFSTAASTTPFFSSSHLPLSSSSNPSRKIKRKMDGAAAAASMSEEKEEGEEEERKHFKRQRSLSCSSLTDKNKEARRLHLEESLGREVRNREEEEEKKKTTMMWTTKKTQRREEGKVNRRRARVDEDGESLHYSSTDQILIEKYLELLLRVSKTNVKPRLQLVLACIDALLTHPVEKELVGGEFDTSFSTPAENGNKKTKETDGEDERGGQRKEKHRDDDAKKKKHTMNHHTLHLQNSSSSISRRTTTPPVDHLPSSTLHMKVLCELQRILSLETKRDAGFCNPFLKDNSSGARGDEGGGRRWEDDSEEQTLNIREWALPSITWCALTVLAKLLGASLPMKLDYRWGYLGEGEEYFMYPSRHRERLTRSFFAGTERMVSLSGTKHKVDLIGFRDHFDRFGRAISPVYFQPVPFCQIFTGLAGHPLPTTPQGEAMGMRLLSSSSSMYSIAQSLKSVLRVLCFGNTVTACLARVVYLHAVCCGTPEETEVVYAPFREMITREAVEPLKKLAEKLLRRDAAGTSGSAAAGWSTVLLQAGVVEAIEKWDAATESMEEEESPELIIVDEEEKAEGEEEEERWTKTKKNKRVEEKHKNNPNKDLRKEERTHVEEEEIKEERGVRTRGGSGLVQSFPSSSSGIIRSHMWEEEEAAEGGSARGRRHRVSPVLALVQYPSLNEEEEEEGCPTTTSSSSGVVGERKSSCTSRRQARGGNTAQRKRIVPHTTGLPISTAALVEEVCRGHSAAVPSFITACQNGSISFADTQKVLRQVVRKRKEEEKTKSTRDAEKDEGGEEEGKLSVPPSSSFADHLSSTLRSGLESHLTKLFEAVTMEGGKRPLLPTVQALPNSSVYVCQDAENATARGPSCPQGHPLLVYHGSEWCCNVCQGQTAYGSHACRRCNYDICYVCLQKSSRCIPVNCTTSIGDVLRSWTELGPAEASHSHLTRTARTAAAGSPPPPPPPSSPPRVRTLLSDSSSPTSAARGEAGLSLPLVHERGKEGREGGGGGGMLPLVVPAVLHPYPHIQSASAPCLCGTTCPQGKLYLCDALITSPTPFSALLEAFGDALFREHKDVMILGLYGALEGIAADLALRGAAALPSALQEVLLGFRHQLPCNVKREVGHFMAVECIRYASSALVNASMEFPGAIPSDLSNREGGGLLLGPVKAQVRREHFSELIDMLWPLFSRAPPLVNTVELSIEGEEGTGSGPTQEAYAELCRLCKLEKSLWYTKEEDGGTYWACPSHTTVHAREFYILGVACGRGFTDNYMVEIPLLPELWSFIRYGAASFVDNEEEDNSVEEKESKRRREGGTSTSFPSSSSSSSSHSSGSLDDFRWKLLRCVDEALYHSYSLVLSATEQELESMDLVDVDEDVDHDVSSKDSHMSHEVKEEESRGERTPIRTREQAQRFVQKQVEKHFRLTMENVRYFQLGLSTVVDLNLFWFFSNEELNEVFCGAIGKEEAEGKCRKKLFDEDEFRSMIVPEHGYEQGSPIIEQLISIVCHSFSRTEQEYFLEFLTGTTRLPANGLCGLSRKIKVVKKEMEGKGEETLPSCMTCFFYLKIPPYSSEEIMRKRLLFAVSEGRRSFCYS